ncbi:glutathione S-transferase kappa 1-like [Centruroides sculpturatus]|uniref:glutathione S-transferase kappa 1-like n=1 Tax=Centruroides sculpturatus TaxID=218467 RepID=UPI000C6DD91B|nr:glutathione S-transferase kappa 1-like [Centruroides sculpturatus]XP_023233743.1 glutathione S-transferase kappa 1-like [Centruroides sculpturatus]
MVPSKITVEFFYDVVSPYSWIAFEVLCRYKVKWGLDLQWRPFFLGAIMKESGNNPPAFVANKALYMREDLKRLADYTKIPVCIPENFSEIMRNTLGTQRFITAVDMKYPQYTEQLSRQFWTKIFKTFEDVTQVESMKETAKEIGMKDSEVNDVAAKITAKETKDRLREFTEKALNYGGFGSPIIVAHVNSKPEMFFGSDRFELLAHVLGKKWDGPRAGSNL